MSQEADGSQQVIGMAEEDKCRHLLQYVLASKGICHENMLILLLMNLEVGNDGFSKDQARIDWNSKLDTLINRINLKLNALGYKIIKANHGLGKKYIGSKTIGSIQKLLFQQNIGAVEQMVECLQRSNRYYVYVNLASTEETKLASTFSPKEIEFIKWVLEQLCLEGSTTTSNGLPTSSPVIREVNIILASAAKSSEDVPKWNKMATFTLGSTRLLQYEDLAATDIEGILSKLCENKWLYKTQQGTYGMDLRCMIELEEYLMSTYGLEGCQICKKLALQGAMCVNCNIGETATGETRETRTTIWHVDCFQHQITHLSPNCTVCGSSLTIDGIYVV